MKKTILSLILFLTASLNASERLNVVMIEVDDLNYKSLAYITSNPGLRQLVSTCFEST